MDQGLWGERGKAPRIVRRDCRQPGPDGLHLVTNTTGFQRYELWCGGKIIDYYSIWNRVGTTAPLPRQQRCEQPQIVQHENEEIVQNDAIERTLGNGRLVAPPA